MSKQSFYLDNRFLRNIFEATENTGVAILNDLESQYNLKITDQVLTEATTDNNYAKDRIVSGFVFNKKITSVVTPTGELSKGVLLENGGELSIIQALKK